MAAKRSLQRVAFSIEEAMRSAGLPREAYYTLPEALRPRHFKVGRQVRITRKALRDWLATLEQTGTVPRVRKPKVRNTAPTLARGARASVLTGPELRP